MPKIKAIINQVLTNTVNTSISLAAVQKLLDSPHKLLKALTPPYSRFGFYTRNPGCQKHYNLRGLRRHFAQTNNPFCIEYANSTPATAADPLFSDEEQEDFLDDFDFDSGPVLFNGDYFGNDYTMHELGQGGDQWAGMENDAHDVDGGDWGNEQPEEGEEDEGKGEDEEEDEERDLDDFDEDEMNAMLEEIGERPRRTTDADLSRVLEDEILVHGVEGSLNNQAESLPTPTRRAKIEDRLRQPPTIVHFGGQAGQPIADGSREDADTRYRRKLGGDSNIWHPFISQIDWEVARWAKLRGPGSNAFNEFLKIPGVVDALGLSFKTTQELNKIVDSELPGRPLFTRSEAMVADEPFEFYHRDILECIKALWGDPDFSAYLIMCPERHYTDDSLTKRLFHNMHTGEWWWSTQEEVERKKPGATIIPIIISSDKTQLTVFGNKTAYPVYMSIGNIPKEIRRKTSRGAYLLLAYLPTSKLSHIRKKAARKRALANLFHACMKHVLGPLKEAGVRGMKVVDGVGIPRRGHPIFAVYVADYPEQTLATTAKGNRCPALCPTKPEQLGDDNTNGPFLDLQDALDVLLTISEGPTAFAKRCKDNGMKPIPNPFWKDLPHTNIFHSVTPDILHQLYQGLIKHLIAWLIKIIGAVEIDARCRRFPPNHNIRLFLRGISGLSRVTGTEHQMIGRFLLGLIIDVRIPGHRSSSSSRLCAAVRGMLDFVYLAQYPLHTSDSLQLLEEALTRFHDHKDVFVELGACSGFRIPKLHGCQHYSRHFMNFGTADNYNTEYTERLHIDLAKDAYRSTNRRDELPQMVLWLDRREKLHRHTKFISSLLSQSSAPPLVYDITPGVAFERTMKISRHPTVKSVPFTKIISDYGATHFREALARYIVGVRHPELSTRTLVRESERLYLPFFRVPVWHKVKWTTPDMYSLTEMGTVIVDSAHVNPARTNKRGHVVPGRFDTVLVNLGNGGTFGVSGYRVGQVRLLFTLRKSHLDALFEGDEQDYIPRHLAYVEWFTPFRSSPEPVHGLYKISRAITDGNRDSSIVPVADFRRSVHLYPKFGPIVPEEWTSSNVLDEASVFYINSYSDRHAYYTIL
ncbi:hypothetical protein V5O48_009844 [Marasmius crinis-equi]|uniref:Uncharacterized protein n=1 Tax=Marasmius crinis-equi TaxID=585013 RepID=A0ABR3F9X4_9AGAR